MTIANDKMTKSSLRKMQTFKGDSDEEYNLESLVMMTLCFLISNFLICPHDYDSLCSSISIGKETFFLQNFD
jgi:hypothetical protein